MNPPRAPRSPSARRLRRALPVLLLLLLAAPAAARAGEEAPDGGVTTRPPGVFPLAEVRPGMRGTAYTVLHGTGLESFEVEVIDVVANFLPRQDVILVRCLGDRIAHLGVAQGMSGSPVFIDGRVVGALAYTWGWAKDAIAGVTPLEAMLADARRPEEGRPSGAEPPTPLRTPRPVPIGAAGGALADLVPIGTPVCAGGFSPGARREIAEALAPLGLDLRAAGGGLVAGAPQGWANLDAPVVPGAALVVDLVRGDYALSVLGTLTYVDGDRLHAFGHPFQSLGETLLPVSVGYVYTVVASRNMSFKLGASVREIGALVHDLDSGVVAEQGRKAPMVPFDLTVRNAATGHRQDFHFEVTANRLFFQRMTTVALRDAIAHAEPSLGATTKRYRMEVKLAGVAETWTYEDSFVSFDSGFNRVLIGLVDRVMIHPTQRAEFERVRLDFEVENVDRRATIENVVATKDEARPGEEVELLVRLRRREGGALFVERVPVRVPEGAGPGDVVLQVTGGDNVAADVASPVDVADIPALYGAFLKSTELVVLVPTGRVDLDMDGRLFRNLPLSALPRLLRSPEAVQAKLRPVTDEVRRSVDYIVDGSGQAVVRVVR